MLERGVRKAKRKCFAATTEANHNSARIDPKNKKIEWLQIEILPIKTKTNKKTHDWNFARKLGEVFRRIGV